MLRSTDKDAIAMGLRGCSIAVLVLLLILGVTGYWLLSNTANSRIQSIAAAGDPVSVADLEPEAVPDDQNAAIALAVLSDRIQAMQGTLASVFENRDPVGLTEQQLDTVRSAWESDAGLYDELKAASLLPHYQPKRDYENADLMINSMLTPTQGIREVSRLLQARADSQLIEDEPAEALDTCLTILRFARLTDSEPAMVSFLVGSAIRNQAMNVSTRLLNGHEIEPESHEQLEQELARHDTSERFVWCLKSERAFGISMADQLGLPWIRGRMLGPMLAWTEEELSLVDKPYAEVAPLHRARAVRGVAATIAPAFDSCRVAWDRTRAELRALRVLNAILGANLASDAEVELANLGLPAEATVDPFSGSSLIVKRGDEGWTIYSVGENLTDDGGQLAGEEGQKPPDVGVGPN